MNKLEAIKACMTFLALAAVILAALGLYSRFEVMALSASLVIACWVSTG